jgi:hypothetical protein
MHGVAKHPLDVLVQGDCRSHESIMMPYPFAVKMLAFATRLLNPRSGIRTLFVWLREG